MRYATLKQRIKEHEGFRNQVYMDSIGNPTIGYGHLITNADSFKMGKTYETKVLDEVFDKDFNIAVEHAEQLLAGIDICITAKEVIIEMVFQLGIGGVSKFKKMFEALRKEDYNQAANEMLNSLWFQQTPQRCKKLSDIMRQC